MLFELLLLLLLLLLLEPARCRDLRRILPDARTRVVASRPDAALIRRSLDSAGLWDRYVNHLFISREVTDAAT
jgi:hypothetical protein